MATTRLQGGEAVQVDLQTPAVEGGGHVRAVRLPSAICRGSRIEEP